MSTYRTVTVTPELTSNINVTASLTDNVISVTSSFQGEAMTDPALTDSDGNSIVDSDSNQVTALVFTPTALNVIEATAELSNEVVNITATLHDNQLEVDAECYTEIRTYSEDVEYYTGDYEFTPSEETQTISVSYLMPTQDITINPIPSNYGLVTWNGSTLTVS